MSNWIYEFDKHFFDEINSEEKAYWIGFIWCDGYVCRRNRKNSIAYEFKLDLSSVDEQHLVKLNNSIGGNYPIRKYRNGASSYKPNSSISRLYIGSSYFGRTLYEGYGLVPHRSNISPLLEKVPSQYYAHFIRGIVDAEGSISVYSVQDSGKTRNKATIQISTYEGILNFINNHLNNIGVSTIQKLYKRHEDRDENCSVLSYSGNSQVLNILEYLYNNSSMHLDRKHQEYISLVARESIN